MKRILFFIMTVISLLGYSQSGPGGVGSNDGTSNLEFWYMAQDETYLDGDLVNSVTDRSGNGRTLSAAGGERPTYTFATAGANNISSFLFALNDELETTYVGNSNENMSFGMALSYINSGDLNIALQHGGRNTIGINNTHFFSDFVGGSNHISVAVATATWTYHHKTFANSGANRLKFYVNNTNTDNFAHTIENRTSNTWIGGHGTGGGTGFNGSIAEVFKFSRVLNTAEQIIIANYFSAKYAMNLTSIDIYDEDAAVNGNYDFDVAGIGQASDGTNHLDSRGTGIVRILGASNLNNNEFLIWGHDNASQQVTEVIDVPAGVQERFSRIWRVSEVNSAGTAVDVGSINMRFDLSSLGAVTASDLRLLIDSDNDGSFLDETIGTGGVISGATSLGSNIYQFAGVSAITNNLRFTLGTINLLQTPLPIELINFNATILDIKQQVLLDWQTASEISNDYFTLERSQNGFEWKEMININGAGNSSTLLNYSTIDDNPYFGISYYRLKQTDFDGQYSYSQVRSVNIKNEGNAEIEILPNPTEGQITIIGDVFELDQVKIYNTLGQDVTIFTKQKRNGKSKLTIDLLDLAEGMYYIKTKTTANKVYKQ